MKSKYIGDGDFLDYTPTTDVAAGEVIVIYDRAFIAIKPIKAGDVGSVAAKGMWLLPKRAGETWDLCRRIYWINATQEATERWTPVLLGYSTAIYGPTDTMAAVQVDAYESHSNMQNKQKTLDKTVGEAWALGALIYWDAATSKATTNSNSDANDYVGEAAAAAIAGDTTGLVWVGVNHPLLSE